jgi:hypothetical protein
MKDKKDLMRSKGYDKLGADERRYRRELAETSRMFGKKSKETLKVQEDYKKAQIKRM